MAADEQGASTGATPRAGREARPGGWAIVVAAILGVSLFASALVASRAFVKSRAHTRTVAVTGSAKKQITSDLAVWTASFTAQAPTLSEAYGRIKTAASTVGGYLEDQGIDEEATEFGAVSTEVVYALDEEGNTTNQVESFRLWQQVKVTSNDVQQIADLATTSTELIEQGVAFQSDAPRYFYTKIADLKLDMIALATENARARATTIAEKAGSKVRGVRDARAGVFQINPLYTDEVSDYGVNDTTSIEKEISAVVNAEFELD